MARGRGLLAELLAELFSPVELQRFLLGAAGRVAVKGLPDLRSTPPERYAELAAVTLQRQGLVNGALFDRLIKERPGRHEDIAQVRRQVLADDVPITRKGRASVRQEYRDVMRLVPPGGWPDALVRLGPPFDELSVDIPDDESHEHVTLAMIEILRRRRLLDRFFEQVVDAPTQRGIPVESSREDDRPRRIVVVASDADLGGGVAVAVSQLLDPALGGIEYLPPKALPDAGPVDLFLVLLDARLGSAVSQLRSVLAPADPGGTPARVAVAAGAALPRALRGVRWLDGSFSLPSADRDSNVARWSREFAQFFDGHIGGLPDVVVTTAELQLRLAEHGTAPAPESDASVRTEPVFVGSTGLFSDHKTHEDLLGFSPYVGALADRLTSVETQPPITASVEGSWGSGKSSFMAMLAEGIRKRDSQALVIHIDAWQYDQADELWAAFALDFMRGLREEHRRIEGKLPPVYGPVARIRRVLWAPVRFTSARLGDVQRGLRHLRMWGRRLGQTARLGSLMQGAMWMVVSVAVVATLVFAPELFGLQFPQPGVLLDTFDLLPEGWAAPLSQFANANAWLYRLLVVLLAGPLLGRAVSWWFWGSLFSDLSRAQGDGAYDARVPLLRQVQQDVAGIIELYGAERITVLVDDLDRCTVPTSARLMQAINKLVANHPQLIFVLAMDRAKVAAGIAALHHDILPYLVHPDDGETGAESAMRGLEYGYAFIEKFVQLPFALPAPGADEIATMLGYVDPPRGADALEQQEAVVIERDVYRSRLADPDRQRQIVRALAGSLQYNPRRIKQFVNLFLLRADIAVEQGLFDQRADGPDERLTFEQLAKFIVLGLCWPELVQELAGDPTLLEQLQRVAADPQARPVGSDESVERLAYWASRREVLAHLRTGMALDPARWGLERLDVDDLIKVSPATSAVGALDDAAQGLRA